MIKHLATSHKLYFVPCEKDSLNIVRDYLTGELMNNNIIPKSKYLVTNEELLNFEFQLGLKNIEDTYFIGLIADDLDDKVLNILRDNLMLLSLDEILDELKKKS